MEIELIFLRNMIIINFWIKCKEYFSFDGEVFFQ